MCSFYVLIIYTMTETILHACSDWFNTNMIWKHETAGAVSTNQLPRKFSLKRTKILDQYAQDSTHYGCTIFWESRTLHDQENMVSLNPVVERDDAVLRGARREFWRSLQEAVLMFLDKWYIKWYWYVDHDVADMKQAIYDWSPLYTWTSKCNWTATFKDLLKVFAVVDRGPWHAFEISGRDDDYEDSIWRIGAFEATNSSSKNPKFYIMYEDIKNLYSLIALIMDESSVKARKERENKKTLQDMISRWITNGEQLYTPIKRWQIALMIGRYIYKWQDFNDDQILAKTIDDWIRNWNNSEADAARNEIMIMMWRIVIPDKRIIMKDHQLIELLIRIGITNWNNQSNRASRYEWILLLWRTIRYLEQN